MMLRRRPPQATQASPDEGIISTKQQQAVVVTKNALSLIVEDPQNVILGQLN